MVRTSGTVELALIVQGFATLLLLNGIIRILLKPSLLSRLQQCQFGLFALLLHHIYTAGRGDGNGGLGPKKKKKKKEFKRKKKFVSTKRRPFV